MHETGIGHVGGAEVEPSQVRQPLQVGQPRVADARVAEGEHFEARLPGQDAQVVVFHFGAEQVHVQDRLAGGRGTAPPGRRAPPSSTPPATAAGTSHHGFRSPRATGSGALGRATPLSAANGDSSSVTVLTAATGFAWIPVFVNGSRASATSL